MNREIKFRAKRIDNGEFVYGFLYRHDPPLQCFAGEGKELPSFAIIKTGFADWNMPRPIEQHEVNGKTIDQYTGLKDKNKKEVYEGDILNFNNERFKIVYDEKGMMFTALHTDHLGRQHFLQPHNLISSEIIGNIYENPELLN